jgi:hypothetical protein
MDPPILTRQAGRHGLWIFASRRLRAKRVRMKADSPDPTLAGYRPDDGQYGRLWRISQAHLLVPARAGSDEPFLVGRLSLRHATARIFNAACRPSPMNSNIQMRISIARASVSVCTPQTARFDTIARNKHDANRERYVYKKYACMNEHIYYSQTLWSASEKIVLS